MAAFRVRHGGGAFLPVLLPPGAAAQDIKEAVALTVGLAVGTFGVRSAADGVASPLHAGLAGDWDVVLLPAGPPGAGAPAAASSAVGTRGGGGGGADGGGARARFEAFLRDAGVRPRPDVLLRLQFLRDTAILSAGSPAEARQWYEWARDLPHSPTRGRFRSATGHFLDGPSAFDANILLAFDAGGAAAMFKVMPSAECAEVVAARAVSGGPGLVPCELLCAERESGAPFCGLLMPKYDRSLATVPELVLAEDVLLKRAEVLLAAVRHVHGAGFVHMDVKEANVFVDAAGGWWLGDFGSAVREGAHVTSTTRGLHPELEDWHLRRPTPAQRRFDAYMLAALLVRQLDAPRDRALGTDAASGTPPSPDAVRARARRVRSDALRALLEGLLDEAGLDR